MGGIGRKASCNKYYWDTLLQLRKIFKADDFPDTDWSWFVLCGEKEIMDLTFVCLFHFFFFFFDKAEGGGRAPSKQNLPCVRVTFSWMAQHRWGCTKTASGKGTFSSPTLFIVDVAWKNISLNICTSVGNNFRWDLDTSPSTGRC